jgi:beta-lactamase regulating signal transducer with metallopeptidase domain/DNA-binding beta-propeller fold protein YncE
MNASLSSFLGWLLRASWQASVLTVLVLAAQWAFRKKLSARWRHALWFLVLARLVIPCPPSSPVSLFNFARMEKAAASPAAAALAPAPVAKTVVAEPRTSGPVVWIEPAVAISPMQSLPRPAANAPVPNANWFRRENMPKLAALLWMSGLLFFAVRIFRQNAIFLRRFGTPQDVTDSPALALFANCKAQMGVTADIRLCETNLVKSPALHGFVRPRLLLPLGMMCQISAEELRHIFLHELAHVKRRDMAVLWLATLGKTLHWFNPVLWFGFRQMAADRELACDEVVLSNEGERESGRYGETILKLLELCARPAAAPALMGILEDGNQMRRRISRIANFKPRPRRPALAVLLALAVGLVTMTDAQTEKPGAAPARADRGVAATNAGVEQAIRGYQSTIAAYEKDRQQAASAIFHLGECYRQLGKTAEANAQYQRILDEFPNQGEFTGLSQQYLLGLAKAPPGYVLSIGDILYPGGVAVDSEGNVYVSDTHNDRIRKFTSQGVPITQWGGSGSDAGSFNYPQGLAIGPGNNLYVADVQNQRIQKFAADGTFITQWGELGSGPGQFNRPYNVAVYSTKSASVVYVVDNKNNRIQKFTDQGVFISEFGTLGTGAGQLQEPQGVAVDAAGNVYVGDGGNGRVQKFSAQGACLALWQCDNHDVAVDRWDNVYVVSGDSIKMFSSNRDLLTQWGSHGNRPGQFDFAARVTVDPSGSRVLATDANNNRVQIFAYPPSAPRK